MTKVILPTLSALLTLSAVPATAQDCLSADAIISQNNGFLLATTSTFPSGARLSTVVAPLVGSTGAVSGPTSQLAAIASDVDCSAVSTQSIRTHIINLVGYLESPQGRLVITFCDHAAGDNLSARAVPADFVGDLRQAPPPQLPDAQGGWVAVAVQTGLGAPPTIELSQGRISSFAIGGTELDIAQICIN